jgi:hypothetical protein
MPQTGNSKTSVRKCAWEPPRLIELEISAQTKSRRDADDVSRPTEPLPPTGPTTKLGFAFEWGFPLAYRGAK